MKWMGHVAHIEEGRNIGCWLENKKRLCAYGRIILKWIRSRLAGCG
jgi:hypothetical protein